MKLLTSAEIQAADRATFDILGLNVEAVMESAGRAVAAVLLESYGQLSSTGIVVIAGNGNNGADGFVVARTLQGLGVPTKVLSLSPPDSLKGLAAAQARFYQLSGGSVAVIERTNFSQQLESEFARARSPVLIDALFGTGLSRELEPDVRSIVESMNALSAQGRAAVAAVDIPSGIDASTGHVCGSAVRADLTVALQFPKIGHVIFPGTDYCGQTIVADIGLWPNSEIVRSVKRELLTFPEMISAAKCLLPDNPQAHKGAKGHVAIIGGSAGHYGAAKLSGLAALRSGAGLVTLFTPESAAAQLAPEVLELMVASLPDDGSGNFGGSGLATHDSLLQKIDTLVVGPGLGQSGGARQLLSAVLGVAAQQKKRMVLDADALNIIAADASVYTRAADVVMTPHPGEAARLLQTSVADVEADRLTAAATISERFGATVLLKGPRTIVAAADGRQAVNPAVTQVLATAGSGDVLAGIIGALLVGSADTFSAAALAVYVHGLAGETLGQSGTVGVTAADLLFAAPRVLNRLRAASSARPSLLQPILYESLGCLDDELIPEPDQSEHESRTTE